MGSCVSDWLVWEHAFMRFFFFFFFFFFFLIHSFHIAIRQVDEVGNTPLHLAVEYSSLKSIHSLLMIGANPCLLNKNQQSPSSLSSFLPKSNSRKFLKKMAFFLSGSFFSFFVFILLAHPPLLQFFHKYRRRNSR